MREDICKHCFQPIFVHWDETQTFDGINIFKELERLRNWQKEAIVVLNKWYKVSDFLAKNNLVGLGEDYSTKCLETLKSFIEQTDELKRLKSIINEEPRFNRIIHLERTNGELFDEMCRFRKQLRSITQSMAAHPDCIEGSEFYDMVRISEKLI